MGAQVAKAGVCPEAETVGLLPKKQTQGLPPVQGQAPPGWP